MLHARDIRTYKCADPKVLVLKLDLEWMFGWDTMPKKLGPLGELVNE